MATNKIAIEIGAKDRASGVINRVKASTVALGVVMGNLATKMITGAINGLRRWIDEALESEEANVMLAASLRGAGKYTDELQKKYVSLANAVQDETGASDESVKATIAQLTTIGMLSDKMGDAVRSVEAMKALGLSGSRAITMIGRSFDGDFEALQRYIPALQHAKTEQEKIAIVNRMLKAGYEQQTAKLKTVGGAWEALQGRLSDVREALIGTIFDGLELGDTFDKMQASIGAFLSGTSWKNFLSQVEDAAKFAKDIAKSFTVKGGFADFASGVGNIMMAAIKEGADYFTFNVYESLKKAGDTWFGRASRYWGSKSAGANDYDASELSEKGRFKGTFKSSGELAEATQKLKDIVEKNSKVLKKESVETGPGKDDKAPQIKFNYEAWLKKQMIEHDALEEKAKLIIEQEKEREIQTNINDIKKAEETASKKLTTAKENLAKLAVLGVAGFINQKQKENRENEDSAKAEKDMRARITRARKKEARFADGRGRLSKGDKNLLEMDRERQAEIKKNKANLKQAVNEKRTLENLRFIWEQSVKTATETAATELKEIRKTQAKLFTEGGAG